MDQWLNRNIGDSVVVITRSENMRRIRSKNTRPEMVVRRLIHSMGYRYRLHRKDIAGKPDISIRSRKTAIFIHGCFWHQHSGCREGRMPKSNVAYWIPKLRRNVSRDEAALEYLSSLGWKTLVIWECETRDIDTLKNKILLFFVDSTGQRHPDCGP